MSSARVAPLTAHAAQRRQALLPGTGPPSLAPPLAASPPPAAADEDSELPHSVGMAGIVMGSLYALSAIVFAISLWQLLLYRHLTHVIAWCVAGFFVCLAVPITLHGINQHVAYYVSPLQRHYVRCLGLVPIYALECALGEAALLRRERQRARLCSA